MAGVEREDSPLSDCRSLSQNRVDDEKSANQEPKHASGRKRQPRKSAAKSEPDGDAVAVGGVANSEPKAKVKKSRAKKRKAEEEEEYQGDDGDDGASGRNRPTRKSTTNTDADADASPEDTGFEPKARAKKPRTKKRKADEEEEYQGDDGSPEKKKRKRRRKTPENERVYEIAPIAEVLPTTFKGRLGYACLNTILRVSHPDPIFCSRTCRLSTLSTLGPSHLRTLALQNHGIFLFRISSELFPFASHPVHGYTLEFADEELKRAGERAKELGMRLTSHPGQFTQLGSPREVVVKNAVRDLEYHCEMMDRMGMGADSIMIIHMGGTFGDKAATLARFRENYTTLLSPSIKARLVLENDELCYNVDDLLPISRELNIPIIFDYHHDWLNPSFKSDVSAPHVIVKGEGEEGEAVVKEEGSQVVIEKREIKTPQELIPEINAVWHRKGIRPKQHYSEPRRGAVSIMEKRAHSDRVMKLPDGLPDDMDLMLECKDKEQAVLYIYRLYNLKDVDHKVLRPPVEVESLRTGGRKSSKRKKVKAGDDEEGELQVDEDGDGDGVETETTPKSKSKPKPRRPRKSSTKVDADVEAEIGREAEEHGIPLEDVGDALEIDGVDCGSGDEEAVLVDDDGGRAVLKAKDTKRKSRSKFSEKSTLN
ncbi:UV-endonuclease UvdE [Schizopora paradoxa]|uniref:UV-endonuclease UvdE n=1 Tax=Schizopora paradoxa TaxID=27342 RepID=A0A0H2R8N5_9AGAM|nr:UV-endonuclease UvdE [Schizopora paradoxa]